MATKELHGTLLEDQMHRISNSVLDEELLEKIFLWPFFTLVQDINASRFFPVRLSVTNADLSMRPPPGRVWKVHQAFFKFLTDANVADRIVTIEMRTTEAPIISVQGYFYETVAAESNHQSQIGSQVASANPTGYDTAQDKPILTRDVELSIRASNKQAGDTWEGYAIIEETINYEP